MLRQVVSVALCASLSAATADAQTFVCDSSTLMKVKGEWAQHDLNTVHADPSFPTSEYPQVVRRLKEVAAIFREAYPQPMGSDAVWYGSIDGESYLSNGPLPYQFNSFYPSFFCNTYTKKVEPGDESPTWAHVYVNSFAGLFQRLPDDWVINGKTYTLFRLPPKIGTWKGMRLMEPTVSHERSRAVLIGHQGHVPMKAVSRKEFLLGLRGLWVKQQAKSKNMQDYYGTRIALADSLLKEASEATLAQPAIISANETPSAFGGKFSTEAKGGTPIFRFPGGYFNKGLPRDTPQFMVLYWRIGNDVASRAFMRQFEANFPVDKLAAMIDR